MNIFNRCFDDQSQIRIHLETAAVEAIFDRAEAGEFVLCWSFILDYENRLNPNAERREGIKLFRGICRANITASNIIRRLAQRITREFRLWPRDALHVACAEVSGCDFFITCDDKIVRATPRITKGLDLKVRAINPIDFVKKVIANAENDL
ncbi:MAG: PIN domain-containing protein [Candidatus Hydrogenedentes bacterium]|nr:PIN domain-containing protein [Candidatus Hydrogenedentota bacterium]